MAEIDLIKKLEKISLNFPNRLLKIEGYALLKNKKEYLEIIIYKGFSSSTTHPIEIDSEKKVIKFEYFFTRCKLHKAPLSEKQINLLKESENTLLFLKEDYWI